jgi:lipid II:glycine glycyltransferase (peptidoglycan interpeptide bridge formation enzyme)
MNLVEITSPEVWDAFQVAQPFSAFPQSWPWGQFRVSRGCRIKRFALHDDAQRIHVAVQLEYRERKFGFGYWLAPRGPVFSAHLSDPQRRDVMRELCEKLSDVVDLKTKTVFWRMEPVNELGHPDGLVPLSFRRTNAMNPASTRVLDLAPSEEELLKQMHEKTRYNIRLADRNGVTVRRGNGMADLNAFLTLMDETAARDGFVQHAGSYLAATYNALAPQGMATIRLAEHGGKILAANMEISFGDTVTYLYGSSSSESRNVMAPYALHWDAIRDAKKRGFAIYDFWGANPDWKGSYYYKDSWEGISRFKRGFGGRQINLVGTWDLPLMPKIYALMHLKSFFRN